MSTSGNRDAVKSVAEHLFSRRGKGVETVRDDYPREDACDGSVRLTVAMAVAASDKVLETGGEVLHRHGGATRNRSGSGGDGEELVTNGYEVDDIRVAKERAWLRRQHREWRTTEDD
jgi:hypothetical protein